jgi:hypothetical protein
MEVLRRYVDSRFLFGFAGCGLTGCPQLVGLCPLMIGCVDSTTRKYPITAHESKFRVSFEI